MAFKKVRNGGVFTLNNQSFMKVVPVKSLMRSSTIHEVTTRGDFFAVNMSSGELTIISQEKFQAEAFVDGAK